MDVNNQQVPITINGKKALIPWAKMADLIKQRLRQSTAIMSLFDDFEVSPERLDDLAFQIADLDQKYAETDANRMVLNSFLFDDGKFFDKHFYIVAHEIVHWLSRVREEDAYFNDPEEVLGFVSSIAYEMEHNQDPDIIWNKVYPKIAWHFNNEADARDFFKNMIEKAQNLIRETRDEPS
jgi:hypothetical protein